MTRVRLVAAGAVATVTLVAALVVYLHRVNETFRVFESGRVIYTSHHNVQPWWGTYATVAVLLFGGAISGAVLRGVMRFPNRERRRRQKWIGGQRLPGDIP